MEMSRLTREGTAEPVSRDQFLRREERGQGNIIFLPCSADHKHFLLQQYIYTPVRCMGTNDEDIM